ncbi:nucleolar protein [Microsporum canis]
MAPEKKANKRKAAVTATSAPTMSQQPPSKKSKKTQEKPAKFQVAEVKISDSKLVKENGVVNGAKPEKLPVKLDKKPAKEVKPRKRAADFLSDDEDISENEVEYKPEVKKEPQPKKKVKSEKPAAGSMSKDKGSTAAEKTKKAKAKSKEAEKPAKEPSPSELDADSDVSEDDQTLALIRGFESSGESDVSEDEGFEPGQEVPKIPDSKKAMKAIRRKKKENPEPEEPGTVYVGRIPHGFYEDEMRAYFSQFGDISRLRLSRNRTTGKSKHYAFVEFTSTSVAKIVAAAMQNYLMFGHILKCKYIPNDKVHPEMWKGANRRFKKTPWNQIEKRRLEAGKSRDQWSKAISKESSKRAKKAEKMKALGYEYDIPQLKSVEDVPVAPTVQNQIEEGSMSPIAAIEDKKEETPKKQEPKSKDEVAEENTAATKTSSNGKAKKVKTSDVEPAEAVKLLSAGKKEAKKSKKKAQADTSADPEKPAKDQKQSKNASKTKKLEEKPKKVKKAKA